MIIRVFRATVKQGKEADFEAKARALSVPLVKGQRGLVTFLPGKPLRSGEREFVMITVWESIESLQAFAGTDYSAAVIPPEEVPLLESTSVEHYVMYGDSPMASR